MGNVKVFYTNSVNNTKVEKTIQTTERNVQQGNSNMTRTKPDFVQGVGHCNITRIEKTKVWFIGTILASLAL